MPDGDDLLVDALTELAALGTARDREQLAALLDRLEASRLRVLVAGEAKRGKSTLINALLGRDVLPSGVTPLTAVATTVRYGDDPRAEVFFLDGHQEKQPLTALTELVTEKGNPGNRRGIAGVTVPARRGHPGAGRGGRAALRRWHRPDKVWACGRGRAARRVGRRSRPDRDRTGQAGSGVAPGDRLAGRGYVTPHVAGREFVHSWCR
jgi:hypothetical protein